MTTTDVLVEPSVAPGTRATVDSFGWLEGIPRHWRTSRLKRLFTIVNGATPKSDERSYWEGDVAWATPDDLGSLRGSTLQGTERRITMLGYASCGAQLVPAGSLLLSTRAPIGHVAIAGVSMCTNQGCRALVVRTALDTRYFYYALISARPLLQALGQGSTFRELDTQALGGLEVPLPPLDEQRAIAHFIDRETAAIDALIAKKAALIELLEEQRSRVVAEAVLRGVPVHSKLKRTSFQWIGATPQHWDVIRVKYVARLESGHTPSRQIEEYWANCSIPWFGLADVWQIRDSRKEYVLETEEKISELGLANSAARLLPAGTVMLSRTASVGFSAIMGVPMATTQDFVNWVCGPRIRPEYLLYVFRSMTAEFKRLTMGSTHQTIYMPDVGQFVTPLPPIEEQDRIVEHIRRKTSRMDSMAERVRAGIDRLREYRIALITSAIMGRVDVAANRQLRGIE